MRLRASGEPTGILISNIQLGLHVVEDEVQIRCGKHSVVVSRTG